MINQIGNSLFLGIQSYSGLGIFLLIRMLKGSDTVSKKNQRTTNDLNKDIEDMLDNKKLRHFVRWYCDGADVQDYERIKSYTGLEREEALTRYLERDDVKYAISHVVKIQRDINLVKVYQAMLKKALDGDVNSANWIVKFSESSFFNNKRSEIDNILEGLSLDEE